MEIKEKQRGELIIGTQRGQGHRNQDGGIKVTVLC